MVKSQLSLGDRRAILDAVRLANGAAETTAGGVADDVARIDAERDEGHRGDEEDHQEVQKDPPDDVLLHLKQPVRPNLGEHNSSGRSTNIACRGPRPHPRAD
jgi:hypothetical protein